jgi:CheY-like chemotaxis protein
LEADVARTVLLVDDEALVLESTADMLVSLGCEVIMAGNGTEALAKLKADGRIEILMTDINMPGLGGFELAEIAKRLGRDCMLSWYPVWRPTAAVCLSFASRFKCPTLHAL